MKSLKSTLHNLIIEHGSDTTGPAMSDPSVTITLEAPFADNARPRIVLTPIGADTHDVNVFVQSITYNSATDAWLAKIESSVPSIQFQYIVIGHTQNNDRIPISRSRVASGDGVGGSY